jgi:hypothetical protein
VKCLSESSDQEASTHNVTVAQTCSPCKSQSLNSSAVRAGFLQPTFSAGRAAPVIAVSHTASLLSPIPAAYTAATIPLAVRSGKLSVLPSGSLLASLLHCLWPTLNFKQHQMIGDFTPLLLPPVSGRFALLSLVLPCLRLLKHRRLSRRCRFFYKRRSILDYHKLLVQPISVIHEIFEHTKNVPLSY